MTSELNIHTIQNADDAFIDRLSDILPIKEVSIIKPPQTGLLMMTAQDSFETNFYLGEILVTEAMVRYNGQNGYAMLLGDETEKAFLVASVDAIMQGTDEDLKSKIKELFLKQMKKIDSLKMKQAALIAKTKVSFESMPKG